jgi:hypothetical protein
LARRANGGFGRSINWLRETRSRPSAGPSRHPPITRVARRDTVIKGMDHTCRDRVGFTLCRIVDRSDFELRLREGEQRADRPVADGLLEMQEPGRRTSTGPGADDPSLTRGLLVRDLVRILLHSMPACASAHEA